VDQEALKSKLVTIVKMLPASAAITGSFNGEAVRGSNATHPSAALQSDSEVEFQFSISDNWQHQLFNALANHYGLRPFRYDGQRDTTIMLKAPERFIEDTFWPQYQNLSNTLRNWLESFTSSVIQDVFQVESIKFEKPTAAAHEPALTEPLA
jgi:hypothetical protein